ncbi:hypothetical protein RI543_002931 [Arxiozyma heterogenica]|uniref:SCP domain-containing protein n=1 Tax=Arxiozyma heterogenica TaxID=278026 RepID=A0AAN7WPH0_9SACH|nr:hypothetical protein RI543_002931 [Kazachstania heterogenica]
MISSTLSLCAPLLLAAFFDVCKAQTDATDRSTTTATTSTDYTKYALTPEEQAAVVLAHNKLRALHVDTGNLTWSNTLAVYAEKYAAVYDCSSGRLVHSRGPYGENLALGFPNAVAAVDAWYSEIAHYNYSHPGFSMATGHFTQVVWRSTKEVGCAVKHCGSYYRDYVVCEYAPPGNYAGEFPENVMPLKASVSSSTSSKPKSSFTPSATSKKSTSSNSHGSAIDATDRSTITSKKSTSSNSHGSAIDATDRSTTTATTSTDYTKYALTPEEQAAVVLAHNKLRALHVDTGNLTWSNTLAVYAEKYAAVYDCSSGRLVHSRGPYGENLALGFPNAVAAVDAWYSEIAHYNYSHPGFSMATGHFTQVVWRSTKEVGCAVKHCGSYYRDYVVCEYAPPGNYAGEFPENVMPLKASVSSSTSSKPKSSSTPSATSEKSTSSNSHGSAIDATDRSTITSKKSTSSNSHGSAIDATDRSTITSKRSTSSNNRSSSINATDRSTTLSNNFTSSSSNGSAIDATDRSTTTRTSAPNNSIGSAIGASGKTHVASEGAPAKTNVAHSVTTATVESARTVDVTECPICSLSTATSSFSSQNGQTALHGEPVLRVSTVYTTDGVVITTYTTSCPDSAKTGSVSASAATTIEHSEVSMESAHANVVPSVSIITSASNSAASVTIAKYEGLAASLTSDVLFSAILMALIHLI